MFHIFKLLVLVMFLISSFSSFETANERGNNKWKLPSWIMPLKIGLIGGLLYSRTKHIRPVIFFADSGSHFTSTIQNKGYESLPYPLTIQPLIVPEHPMSQTHFMDQMTCLYGKANRCREFHGQEGNRGLELPGNVRQQSVPVHLNTPNSQQGEYDAGMNFNPRNTVFQTNTRGTNVNFRHNVKDFTPSRPGNSRKTEPGIDLDGNTSNSKPSTSAVTPFPIIPFINRERQNASSTVVSFGHVQMQDPRRYLTILSNFSTDSLESTPKPS